MNTVKVKQTYNHKTTSHNYSYPTKQPYDSKNTIKVLQQCNHTTASTKLRQSNHTTNGTQLKLSYHTAIQQQEHN